MRLPLLIVSFVLLAIPDLSADEAKSDPVLAEKAYNILKERCSRCHGGSAVQAGIDVLSRDNLIRERGEIGAKFAIVSPGDAVKSKLIQAISGDKAYMPEQGSPENQAITDSEKELLKQWVAAGAEFPKRRDVSFVSEKQVLTAVRDFLLKARPDDRSYLRFYNFAHLQNNAAVTELDLRLYRAALSKVVNSLSKERDVHVPQVVPLVSGAGILPAEKDSKDRQAGSLPHEPVIYVIDLRKLGWDRRNLWGKLLKHYPYGLKYDFVKDEELQNLGKDVAKFAEGDLPILRADWFIVTASQPPLYHEFLDIPDTLMGLEHQLQLSLEDNFISGRLHRSGYAKSGVSKQNRLLERHTSPATP